MHKMWIVARHEYFSNLKKPSFLLTAFGIPIFVMVIWAIIFALADNEASFEGRVGYVDQANVISSDVEWYSETDSELVSYDSPDAAQMALDANEIAAYFVVTESYQETGNVQVYSYGGIPDSLKSNIRWYLTQNITHHIAPDGSADRLQSPVDMTIILMNSGRELTSASITGIILTPMLFLVIYMMATQLSGGFLMSGVVEEKGSRIMEILITSISPMQMLMGKLIGLGALGLTQLAVWIVVGIAAVLLGDQVAFLADVVVPVDMMILSVIYFFLSYFMLASLMAGIGVVVGSEQESRQYTGILSMVMVIPFFFIISFIEDPNGAVPVFLSLFPLTSGIAIIMRTAFATVPVEQLVLSILLLLGTAIIVTWASAKIFRWATLLYGKKANIREIIRVLRGSPEIGAIPAKVNEVS